MSYDYFVRITHPYEAIKVVVSLWALRATKLVVYEHTGEKTEKIHCHILILGSNTQKKQLRNIGADHVDLKGNEMCSFKEAVSYDTPLVYMTKGNLDPKYLKGYEAADAAKWKSSWVQPVKYVKQSSVKKLYDEIFPPTGKYQGDWTWPTPEDFVSEEYTAFHKVRIYAKQQIFARSKDQMWTPKCFSDYKTIVYTICFHADIPIPKQTEWGKWI